MIQALRALALVSFAALALPMPGKANDGPIAETDAGTLRGVAGPDTVGFYGIPYAAPPVGNLRFVRPQAVTGWNGERLATKPAGQCAQAANPFLPGSQDDLNEDCLYLNVVGPAPGAPDAKLPVMVWIHGGGFASGNGHDYDGRRLAIGGNVIVVTINYRVGVMGFFSHPDLPDSGVFGLLDQQAALRWVRRNISSFGGDPANVTLFGESAGAMSVCAQLVSPGAADLFDKAILESGACSISWWRNLFIPGLDESWQFVPRSETDAQGVESLKALNCQVGTDIPACLRRTDAAALMKAWGLSRPSYGNDVLPDDPAVLLEKGSFNRVPILWGHTRDEQRFFIAGYLMQNSLTATQYDTLLKETFGDRAAEVEQRYPAESADSAALAWSAAATDSSWACRTLADSRLAARHVPVFVFEFGERKPTTLPGPAWTTFDLGAAHGTEVPYLFDLLGIQIPLHDGHKQLSDQMIAYWTRFAATGDPNGPGLPDWPRLGEEPGAHGALRFEVSNGGTRVIDHAVEHHCDFWLRPEMFHSRPSK